MDDDPFRPVPLPPTVASRRNARLRAAALATIPLLLFLAAAVPRVWAPDLVPFGERQAGYVSAANRRAPVSLTELYADPTVPTLALVDPLLRKLPSPVVAWVVLRGLLDALGVALLYLAARRLLGRWPGVLAALLYASSPTAWAASRDVAGPLGASVMAAALLAAAWLVERPTLVSGAIFGVMLGLLARSVPVGLVVVLAGAATLAIGRASWTVGGLGALGLVLAAGPALFTLPDREFVDDLPSVVADATRLPAALVVVAVVCGVALCARLRLVRRAAVVGALVVLAVSVALLGWGIARDQGATTRLAAFAMLRGQRALAEAVLDVTERAGTDELLVPMNPNTADEWPPLPFEALLPDRVRHMRSTSFILPLEREAAYLVRADETTHAELRRPSSSTAPEGVESGLRIVTLRPRSATEWLAGAMPVTDGRFADGTALLGVRREPRQETGIYLAFYWRRPPAVTADPRGSRLQVSLVDSQGATSRTSDRMPAEDGRTDVIVVRTIGFPPPATGSLRILRVTVYDEQNRVIRTATGADSLDVPLGATPR